MCRRSSRPLYGLSSLLYVLPHTVATLIRQRYKLPPHSTLQRLSLLLLYISFDLRALALCLSLSFRIVFSRCLRVRRLLPLHIDLQLGPRRNNCFRRRDMTAASRASDSCSRRASDSSDLEAFSSSPRFRGILFTALQQKMTSRLTTVMCTHAISVAVRSVHSSLALALCTRQDASRSNSAVVISYLAIVLLAGSSLVYARACYILWQEVGFLERSENKAHRAH